MSDIGELLAEKVKVACRKCGLADFTIESPMFKTNSGKEREAGDLFLIWRDCLISFQIKAREVTDTLFSNPDVEIGRIYKRAHRAVEQIKTVKRAISSNKLEKVQNLRGISIPFLERGFSTILGIVVIGLETPKAVLPLDVVVQIVGGLDEIQGIPVHVFSIEDFEATLFELSTIPDLINYLEIRGSLFKSGKIIPPVAEKDFLAVYQTKFPVVEGLLSGEMQYAQIEKDIWKQIVEQNREALEIREGRRRRSQIFDKMIEEAHRSIGFCLEDEIGEQPDYNLQPGSIDNYVFVAEELAGIQRSVRADLAEKIIEKMNKADTSNSKYSFFTARLEGSKTQMVFLAHRGSREERLIVLTNLVSCANEYFGTKCAFGVAMNSINSETASFDFLYVEGGEYPDKEELLALGRKLFGEVKEIEFGEWKTP